LASGVTILLTQLYIHYILSSPNEKKIVGRLFCDINKAFDCDSRTNLEIQAFNTKLSKIATLFSHVTLIKIDFNRKYFTKHGLHLNNAGKEWLAKLIASQIDKLVRDINKTQPIIALNWKEETTNVSINVTNNHKPNLMLNEDDFSNVLVSPIQIHKNQYNKTDSELLCSTSSRQKKAPVTRSKDFFMATVTIDRPKNLSLSQPNINSKEQVHKSQLLTNLNINKIFHIPRHDVTNKNDDTWSVQKVSHFNFPPINTTGTGSVHHCTCGGDIYAHA